jgi:hypothetical protein
MKTKIVGFIAGPSAGKSTLALELAGWMKHKRYNVEYVSEYPKDLAWEEAANLFDDQLHIFGEQWRRNYRLIGKVDWIVTDSPIVTSLFYMKDALKKIPEEYRHGVLYHFRLMVKAAHHSFDHKIFFIDRGDRKFIKEGRIHNEEESKKLDGEIQTIAHKHGIKIDGYVKSLTQILDKLGLK